MAVATTPEQQEAREKTVADELDLPSQLDSVANVGWTAADLYAVKPERIPVRELELEDSVLVVLTPAMRRWQSGDTITLTVPQVGATYKTVIDRIETGVGGSRSFFGRLAPGNMPYSYVITVGERSTFAYLGTPHGPFKLEGGNELAWLTPGVSYDRLFDYTESDYSIQRDDQNRVIRRVAR